MIYERVKYYSRSGRLNDKSKLYRFLLKTLFIFYVIEIDVNLARAAGALQFLVSFFFLLLTDPFHVGFIRRDIFIQCMSG